MRCGKQLLVLLLVVASISTLLPAARAGSSIRQGHAMLSGSPLSAAAAAGATIGDQSVRLLSSAASGITFELNLVRADLHVEPVTAGDKAYVRVSMPGWAVTAQAGAPALPFLAEEIGAPFGAHVAVHVVPGNAHTLALPAPALPVATQKTEWGLPEALDGTPALPETSFVVQEDPEVYGGEAPYPQALAEVASDGVLRQQRVVGVAAYPVQYHPGTQELTVYESLRVEVTFEGALSDILRAPAAESAAYENLLRKNLLNYESARGWRSTAALSVKATGVEEAGVQALPWAPPVPGWRVKVRADGFYKLTQAELDAAGLPVNTLDPLTFRLYNLGSEVAIYVAGEADGSFDETDYLLFYGQALASKYTADNVYWLTYGQGTGLRMGSRDGMPVAPDTPAYYPARRPMESNAYYLPFTPSDDNLDRWMWDYIYPPSRPRWTHTFSLAAPHAGPATLTVAMLGYLQNPINPDHHAVASLNGTQVGELWWDGITWQMWQLGIAQSLLRAGNNTLELECPNDTGVGNDVVYIDWVELAFPNAFLAEGDVLTFGYEASGTWAFQVDGFSNDQLAVYDVTDPAAVAQIVDIGVVRSGNKWTARFQDEVAAPTRYWATAATAYRAVQAIEADTASNLRSTANGADHIVITHQAFSPQAESLRVFRASQGLRAIYVDVQDVYDEFGHGVEGVAPIHDFLAYAYGYWEPPAPSYVVLLGDGHYDPRNYQYSRVSYVPPYLAWVDPWMGETAADNRYVTVVGADALPDMMLGRLAVNSATEATALVTKIMAYEQSPPADWQQRVLAVADNADSGGDFAQMSDDLLAGYLRAPYQAEKVHYGVGAHKTVAAARAAIQGGINAGKLIVNYIGHAASTQWAEEGLFKAADVAGLTNGDKLPVVLAMTCREGYYHYPFPIAEGREALAEVMTRAEGKGAVASWSPTGLGVATGHRYLDEGFFQALFQDGVRTVGQATAAGKLKLWATGTSLDLLDTYLLFGDPALRVRLVPATVLYLPFVAKGAQGPPS